MVDEREGERVYTISINQMLRNFWKSLEFILVYLSAISTAMVLKLAQEKSKLNCSNSHNYTRFTFSISHITIQIRISKFELFIFKF